MEAFVQRDVEVHADQSFLILEIDVVDCLHSVSRVIVIVEFGLNLINDLNALHGERCFLRLLVTEADTHAAGCPNEK